MSHTELSEISSELVRSALDETIKTLTKSSNDGLAITSEIILNNATTIVYRIHFTPTNDTNDSPSSLILKVAPQNLARRALTFAGPRFLREIFLYDEVCKSYFFTRRK